MKTIAYSVYNPNKGGEATILFHNNELKHYGFHVSHFSLASIVKQLLNIDVDCTRISEKELNKLYKLDFELGL